jgi:hypothetical protein
MLKKHWAKFLNFLKKLSISHLNINPYKSVNKKAYDIWCNKIAKTLTGKKHSKQRNKNISKGRKGLGLWKNTKDYNKRCKSQSNGWKNKYKIGGFVT